MQVTIAEAQSELPRLIRAALDGAEVVIAQPGTPQVRLVPLPPMAVARQPGAWGGLPAPAPDWDSAAVNAALARDLESGGP